MFFNLSYKSKTDFSICFGKDVGKLSVSLYGCIIFSIFSVFRAFSDIDATNSLNRFSCFNHCSNSVPSIPAALDLISVATRAVRKRLSNCLMYSNITLSSNTFMLSLGTFCSTSDMVCLIFVILAILIGQ